MNLAGARALVTGGSSGIGAAVVTALLDEGARVAVLDLPGRPGGGELTIACDVSDEEQVVGGVAQARRSLGGLDLAVLNAGTGGFSRLVEMPSEEWDRVMNVNLRGTFLCLRETAAAMVDGGSPGAIVATSSISGSSAERGMGHYNCSKAAVNQLVRIAARELGPHRIRVNAVAPGTTDTPLFAPTEQIPGYWERLRQRTALGTIAGAAQVADVVVALARLDWVTGQILAADGGVSLWSPIDPSDGTDPPGGAR